MEAMGGDLFATKGLEYVLVIGYLLLLVACRRMVGPRRSRAHLPEQAPSALDARSFQLREGLYYHQGHSWAASNGNGLMRIGIDDFAQQLLGPVNGVILPRIGSEVGEGEPAWKMRMGRRSVPMLSPVEGEVVGWNNQVLRSPDLVNNEPYDGGWLLEIKVRNPAAAVRNLLSGNLAHAWLDDSAGRLHKLFESRPDVADAVAASPDAGLARLLSSDTSDRLASEFLLSQSVGDWSPYAAEPQEVAGKDQEEEQLV
jgi:glycine cleavage system H lipoate-binding protein